MGRMPSPFRRRASTPVGGRRVLLGRFGGLVSALQSPGWALLLAVALGGWAVCNRLVCGLVGCGLVVGVIVLRFVGWGEVAHNLAPERAVLCHLVPAVDFDARLLEVLAD